MQLREPQIKRITVLWQAMSGYFDSCLRALAARGIRVSIAYQGALDDAPYDESLFASVSSCYRWTAAPERADVARLIRGSRPDAVLVSSWHIDAYRSALRALRGASIPRVLCMDNQWRGTTRQWIARATWRQYVRPLFDTAFVPGDRQVFFARRLGFRTEHIMRGLYCADTDTFGEGVNGRAERTRAFLYAGRLSEEKGIRTLVEAYVRYRSENSDPWPLRVAGAGPDAARLQGIAGVQLLGFQQARELAQTMWDCCVLVCPSTFEPWGVVVHEATSAGLIVISSEAVGAAVHLVQDGYNGYVVPTGDATYLATAMNSVSDLTPRRRMAMSVASVELSRQFTPDRWAEYVIREVGNETARLRRAPVNQL